MKHWILIFVLSVIGLPGFGKAKIQRPTVKHPTAFAIVVDAVTYGKIPEAVEAYRDALEADGLSTYIVSDRWESPEQVRQAIRMLVKRKPLLEGFVLIGDIPVVMIRNAQHMTTAFKMDEKAFPFIDSSVPSDRFYDDLNLTFDFICQDSVHANYFYYKLREDSPQQLNPGLYSGRIKYPEDRGGDPYEAMARYLEKVVREKRQQNVLDCFTSFTGNAYHSECLLAWMDERLALEENFPLAVGDSRKAHFLNFRMSDDMKLYLLDELQQEELDLLLLHEHGAPDRQYIGEEPAPSGMAEYVQGIKAALYAEVRREIEKGRGTPEEIRDYFIEHYRLDPHFFDALDQPGWQEADSLARARTEILLEDLLPLRTYPRVVLLDACYNGSFHLPAYVAGYYIFNEGRTQVVQANSRNVLQDKWSIELIGLLSQGIRVGQWNCLTATLEGHIIGDPTFRFISTESENLALDIVKNRGQRSLWEKYCRTANPNVQALAWRMLADLDVQQQLSPRLLQLFRESPYCTVRMEALKLLSRYANDDFVTAIGLGLNDSYELIRRNAAIYAGKCGDPRLVAELVHAWAEAPESKRVHELLQNALPLFPVDSVVQALETLKKQYDRTDTFYAVRQRQIADLIEMLTDTETNGLLSYREIPEATMPLKQQIARIRYVRNNPFHFQVEAYLEILKDRRYDPEVRVNVAEALGWFQYSYRKQEIRTALEQLLKDISLPEAVRLEICQTINRLK